MSRKMFEHIQDNLHVLELDIENGLILNRYGKSLIQGYKWISLDNKIVYHHQVLAVARWGTDYIGMTVNHINGDRTDNRAINLELLTHVDNSKAKSGYGAMKQIKAINMTTGEEFIFKGQREAGRVLDIKASNISLVLSGKQSYAKGFTFERIV